MEINQSIVTIESSVIKMVILVHHKLIALGYFANTIQFSNSLVFVGLWIKKFKYITHNKAAKFLM